MTLTSGVKKALLSSARVLSQGCKCMQLNCLLNWRFRWYLLMLIVQCALVRQLIFFPVLRCLSRKFPPNWFLKGEVLILLTLLPIVTERHSAIPWLFSAKAGLYLKYD